MCHVDWGKGSSGTMVLWIESKVVFGIVICFFFFWRIVFFKMWDLVCVMLLLFFFVGGLD